MESKDKPKFGSIGDWGVAIGVLVALVGLLALISGVWTPDAAASAGSGNTLQSVVILVVGVVIAGISYFFRGKK